jgi:DNA-binding beta-propeller fold protein YncE
MRPCFALFCVLAAAAHGEVHAALTWDPFTRFGEAPSREGGELYYPSGVAVDQSNGDVYVADSQNQQVQRFDANGTFLNRWGFGGGIGLTVDPVDSSVYIGSVSTNRMHKFDSLGNELAVWGGTGTSAGQFRRPQDVAVHPVTRNVFVLDADNKRVQEFTPTGGFVQAWPADPDLSRPYGIAIDPTGSVVWIANTGGYNIRKYDLTGNLLLQFGSTGSDPGFLRWPRGMSVDAAGNVFVADTDMERVQKFDSNGTFLQVFMGPENDAQGPAHPRAIDVNQSTGHIYTAAAYSNRIDHFDETGTYIGSWGHHDRDGLFLSTPRGMTVDPHNDLVYVADTNSHLIKKFTYDGVFLGQYGNWPFVHRDETAVSFPASLSTDSLGNYWALNEGVIYPDDPTWGSDKYVRQFDPNGNFLFGFAHPDFTAAMGDIAINEIASEIYVSNTRKNKIMRFDFNGNLLGEWGSKGDGPGQFISPAGIAVNPSQNCVLVADVGNQRIQKFTLDGTFIAEYGGFGSGPGQFILTAYAGVTFDDRDNFYVADTGNHRVQVFDIDGNFLTTVGSVGTGPGQFRGPIAVAYDDGLLFVLESSQKEVEVIQISHAPVTQDTIWVDDSVPAGAIQVGAWNFVSDNPVPFSGTFAHRSPASTGLEQHFFYNATDTMLVGAGDALFAYVYLDPSNPPSEIMLQWYAGGSWGHRAYWGANLINWGTDGTQSRQYLGPLPSSGGWVRLEVPAALVGLENAVVTGMAFTSHGGQVSWDAAGKSNILSTSPPPPPPSPTDTVWLDDAVPTGATQVGAWNFVSADPTPFSGLLAHQSPLAAGFSQHFFYNATDQLAISAGDTLFAYVYLDPANPPSELMLQWYQAGSWQHRAYWGGNFINLGTDGTPSRSYMGPLPPAGGWVRLEVPASAVGLEGTIATGMAFTIYGGRATWDYAGHD